MWTFIGLRCGFGLTTAGLEWCVFLTPGQRALGIGIAALLEIFSQGKAGLIWGWNF